jgi:hypothetical protein
MVDRCYIINLKRRPDRLRAILEKIAATDWPFPEPILFEAIDGDKVGVPPEFTEGGGAYGCRCSHVAILQRCLMEDVQSVLILEDDADIRPWTGAACREFLKRVSPDWQGIMLGGQHHAEPIRVAPGLVRVRYAQRTHAYIARGVYMRALQRRWGNATVHIDWLMENWQERYLVYAPEHWLIGQAGGRSDIRGEEKPPEWWNNTYSGPLFLVDAPPEVREALRDAGFCDRAVIDPDNPRDGLRALAEVCQSGLLPLVPAHLGLAPQTLRAYWEGPVITLTGRSYAEVVDQIPAEYRPPVRRPRTASKTPVVILKCSRCVMEQLRLQGFHTGYYRNEDTGVDVGLAEIVAEGLPRQQLANWLAVIEAEADRDGMVPTIWHPVAEIDPEHVKQATTRPVLCIEGQDTRTILRAFIHATL